MKTNKKTLSWVWDQIHTAIVNMSKDETFALLVLNAISTTVGHYAQIQGLINNKRENSQFLIEQEWIELGLDAAFNIIPAFILRKFLDYKVQSGKIMTKGMKESLEKAKHITKKTEKEIFDTSHFFKLKPKLHKYYYDNKETIDTLLDVKKHKYFNKLRTYAKKVIDKDIKTITIKPKISFRDFCFQNYGADSKHPANIFINKQKGIVLLSAIGYSVLSAAVITPYLKNLISNKRNKKRYEAVQLKLKEYGSYKTQITRSDNAIFNSFSTIDSSLKPKPQVQKKNADNINTFSNITSQYSRLGV